MGSKRVGLRYCSGCNSRYDRVQLMNRLKDLFPEAEFVPAREKLTAVLTEQQVKILSCKGCAGGPSPSATDAVSRLCQPSDPWAGSNSVLFCFTQFTRL